MSDLLRCLAFAFRRKGTMTMPANDLRMLVAFDLNWFAPADAKRFVDRVKQGGFVIDEGGELRIAFDPAAIDVPLNFKPNAATLLEEPFPAMPTAPAPATAPPAAPAGGAPAAPAPAPVSPPATVPVAPPAPPLATRPPASAAAAPPARVPPTPERPAPAAPAAEPVLDAADLERARRGGLLDLRVARLVVARREGEDVKERLADAERALLGK